MTALITESTAKRNVLSRLQVLVLLDEGHLLPGQFQFAPGDGDGNVVESLRRLVASCHVSEFSDIRSLLKLIDDLKPDVVFNLVVAPYGDRLKDGHICATLELEGVPYTGSSARGLMLGRDKAFSKRIAAEAGFSVPRFLLINSRKPTLPHDIVFPLVAKPRYGDASEGMSQGSLLSSRNSLLKRLELLSRRGFQHVICEEYIAGREITVGVLNGRIVRPREFIIGRKDRGAPKIICERLKNDAIYRRRWKVRTEFARLTDAQAQQLEESALKTAAAIEIRDYGRIDVKLTPQNKWFFLEANPNPGLTKMTWHGTWNSVDWDAMIAEIVMSAHQRGCGVGACL